MKHLTAIVTLLLIVAAFTAAAGQQDLPGVALDPAEVASLGIATQPLAALRHQGETPGFAVVLDHERIAQAVADVAIAEAAVRQSRAVLERLTRLAGTEGAETVEIQEGAERQAAADAAVLALARRKSSTVLGQNPPWAAAAASALRDALADGRAKLIRVTFPQGLPGGAGPASVRLARVGSAANEAPWYSRQVWSAPADPQVPGRSFFAALETGDVGEGEHLSAWAPQGDAQEGAVVPAAALLADSGRYWCYVERSPGRFSRVALDLDQPTPQGYFVTGSLRPGDKVVVAAAGLLLARELHPGADAD
jgi:hypothetical protein